MMEEFYDGNKDFTENCFAITFDDGFKDIYTNALPILKKHNLAACVFLTADMINANDLLPHHKLYFIIKQYGIEAITKAISQRYKYFTMPKPDFYYCHNPIDFRTDLEKTLCFQMASDAGKDLLNYLMKSFCVDDFAREAEQLYLNWSEIIEMKGACITFGCHTCSHPILSKLTPEGQEKEILECKRKIEEKIKEEVKYFAYPYGYPDTYNEQTLSILHEGGFSLAFIGVKKRSVSNFERFEIPRIVIGNMPIWEFSFEILLSRRHN